MPVPFCDDIFAQAFLVLTFFTCICFEMPFFNAAYIMAATV